MQEILKNAKSKGKLKINPNKKQRKTEIAITQNSLDLNKTGTQFMPASQNNNNTSALD
jgi:hypothetical protein